MKRQMHLGLFILGTGSHVAGWRYPGRGRQLSGFRGDPADRPHRRARQVRPDLHGRQSLCRCGRPSLLHAAARAADDAGRARDLDQPYRPRRHRLHHLQRSVLGRARLRLARSHLQGPRGVECGDDGQSGHGRRISAPPIPTTPSATRWRANSSTSSRACGTAGRTTPSSPTARAASTSIRRSCARSTMTAPFFKVKGPLNIGRSPQGQPIVLQAGGSEAGQALAARTADIVFSVVQDIEEAKAGYASLKDAAAGVRPQARARHGAAGRDAGRRPHRQGGVREAQRAPELRQRQQRARHSCPTASGATCRPTTSTGRSRTSRRQTAITASPASCSPRRRREDMTPARSLQSHRRRARPLGAVRLGRAHRRHAAALVRGARRRRLQRHAALFPRRLRRFRRARRAYPAGARPVPRASTRARRCAISSACLDRRMPNSR